MLDWQKYISIADRFQHKARREDREDLRQTIILRLAEVETKYNGNGKVLTKWGMLRVASYTVLRYWREYYYRTNGVDCGRCSNSQREKCQAKDRFAQCPRAIRIESLNSEVEDGDGNTVELWQTIADDKAIDLDNWLDANLMLYRIPQKIVSIAYKKVNGLPLTNAEREYLRRHRQKRLF